MGVRVITDSASYLPEPLRARSRILEVSLYVREGDRIVRETELDLPAFYRRIADLPGLPATSQPAPEDFAAAFEEAVADGSEALAVVLSGSMSSTLAAADAGARGVRAARPDAVIRVLDSRANCMQEGFAVLAAAEAAESGGTLAECEAAARESMRRSRFLFAPQSLEYLKRGGRISGAAALLGSVLGVIPVLTAEDGQTAVAGRARSYRKAMAAVADRMRSDVARFGLKRAVVQGIVDVEQAREFAERFIEPIVGEPVPVLPVGPVVGIHVGLAVGVAYETIEPLR